MGTGEALGAALGGAFAAGVIAGSLGTAAAAAMLARRYFGRTVRHLEREGWTIIPPRDP